MLHLWVIVCCSVTECCTRKCVAVWQSVAPAIVLKWDRVLHSRVWCGVTECCSRKCVAVWQSCTYKCVAVRQSVAFAGVLQCATVSHSRVIGREFNTMQYIATRRKTLQQLLVLARVALSRMRVVYRSLCDVLQHIATHISERAGETALQFNALSHCNTLQQAATHCNKLQHCNTLQKSFSNEQVMLRETCQYTHAHIHTHRHRHLRTHTRVRTHKYTHNNTHIHITHTHTHVACTHAHTHTYTYIHTYNWHAHTLVGL